MVSQSENQPQFVFTLNEDTAAEPQNRSNADEADWERSLERLRRNKKQTAPALPIDDIFAQTAAQPRRPAVQPVVPRSAVVPPAAAVQPQQTAPNVPPRAAAPLPAADEVILDPAQRERVYRAYLQEWQHKTTLEQEQKEQVLRDDAVLFQEDWMAAQECLKTADAQTPAVCTVRLKADTAEVVETAGAEADALPENTAETAQTDSAAAFQAADAQPSDNGAPVVHVHLHVLEPQGAQGRKVRCISEKEWVQQLTDKLRPHLADAVAGMVRVAVQKHMAHVVNDLHKQLLSEVPDMVDDVLRHNLERALQQVKNGR